jgi:Cu/Ag efflux protein CusF
MNRVPKWFLLVLALVFLLGLAAPVLADEAKGKIKSVDADKSQFVVTDKDGKDWTFKMDDNAKIRLNDKDSKLNDLKEGDEVKVTYEKKADQMIASEVRCERK